MNPPGLLAHLGAVVARAVGRRPATQSSPSFEGVLLSERSTPPPRGVGEMLRAFSEHPVLRCAADRISDAVAAVRWHVRAKRGQQGALVDLPDHPLLTLANPLMSRTALLKLATLHVDLAGEAFLVIERDLRGVPAGLWPLSPVWVAEVARPNRPRFVVQIEGRRHELPAGDVLWLRDIDPGDPYSRGSGTARALSDEVETDEFAAQHMKAFFYNSARPDMIVTLEGVREGDLRAAEQRWAAGHQGFFRAFKPFFASRRVRVDEIGQTLRDMRFVELREFERDLVLQTFGVPPEIVGVVENSNRATITAASVIFGRYVLAPRLELIRETFQAGLVPLYGKDLVLEYESPIPSDRELELEAAKAAPWALMADEWRAAAGLGPLPTGEGGVHAVPRGFEFRRRLVEAPEPDVFLPDPEEGDP